MKLPNKVAAFGHALAFKCALLRLGRSRFGRHLLLSGATTKPTNDTFVSNSIRVGVLRGIGDLDVVAGLKYYHYTVIVGEQKRTWAVEHTTADTYHYNQMYESAMIDWDVSLEGYESVMKKLRAGLDPKVVFLAESTEIEFCQ